MATLGWDNKALREARTEAPGGGRGKRCAQQAGTTATVILEQYLVILEKCYAVTQLRPIPPHPPILVISE